MKKILVGVAILAVSTSAAFAAKKHMAKPAAAATAAPMMMNGGPTAADMTMYKKNQHDSGMKK
jgi:hypothetical protein